MRRGGVLAVVAGAFLVLWAGPASAHALVKSSDPAANSTVQSSPSRVLIVFTERPDVKLTFVHVLNSSGATQESGPAEAVPGQSDAVQVPVPTLPKGVYTVTWRTVSRDDGHVTAGSFSFGVQVKVTGPPPSGTSLPTTPPPSVLAVAARWCFYWGLAILLGASVAGSVVQRKHSTGVRMLLGAGWGIAAIGLVLMTFAERSTVGVPLGTLLSSDAGHEFLDRGVALLICGGAVVYTLFNRSWTALPWVAAASAAVMLVHALAGHGAAASPEWFNVGVQWFHMLGAGIWVGGLVWLLFALKYTPSEDRPSLVTRFSRLATWGLIAVAITGLIRALDQIGPFVDWGRLFTTSYGVTLVVKIAIAAVLVAFGAMNRYRNVPAVAKHEKPPGILRRTVLAEVLIASGVFAATGVLSELPPANVSSAAQTVAATPPLVVTGQDFAQSVKVRMTVTPGTVGVNAFDARITDFDTGKPVQATSVVLNLSLPGNPSVGNPQLALKETRNGIWSARGTVLSIFGRWQASMVIQQASGGVEVPLEIQPRLPTQTISSPSPPAGQPLVFFITLPDGAQLQTYIDPGKAGTNNVHFTFFGANGNEMPIKTADASALTPSGSTEPLDLRRFSAGHFVATTKLDPGKWLFLIDATARPDTPYTGYFQQTIP
ncbi:MAG TPA: CopD family protein [Actinomycetota bacterium]|nr:CopD family protein [Actinomycetota bacterium]